MSTYTHRSQFVRIHGPDQVLAYCFEQAPPDHLGIFRCVQAHLHVELLLPSTKDFRVFLRVYPGLPEQPATSYLVTLFRTFSMKSSQIGGEKDVLRGNAIKFRATFINVNS